jgi:4-hydroxy-4-methyl-2-oxoglutarate aldolase
MWKTLILFVIALPLVAQQPPAPLSDEAILKLYDGLRVADVADGMDIAGLRNVGLVDQRVQALWKDLDEFDHQIRGIAVTVRYVPHNKVLPNPMTPEKFAEWEGNWYGSISTEPFVPFIKKGTIVVIDASGNGDTGSVGSFNSLDWYARGAIGIVTTGSVRDTDEIIKQQIPLYMDPLQRGRGIRPGRNMVESVNQPVEIGGALVRPGDVIVADGDGVIVVPRKVALEVARYAHKVIDGDKNARRDLYKKLGLPADKSTN